ncbi:hypothetical protein BHE90_017172 [Fusarium euwallaceae]|uniref:Deoxyribonuclease NucA/NucB domain-containing protein n=1 Tax=Fusarium euwallaceae TaxID=1147111 RepID=A0A430KY97_9HYPO|nr:hypothetical protein BHE90_017172 [Fusarium euwallaceae]
MTMLLSILGLSLLARGAFSSAALDDSTAEYVLAEDLVFANGFTPISNLLQGGTTLQRRQQFQCLNPGWVQCPNIPGRCKPPTATCCDATYYYYPDSQICCPGRGACKLGYKCCPNNCCTADGRCGSDGYCSTLVNVEPTRTMSQQTRTSTSTSTRTTSQAPTRASTTAAYTTGGCSTSTPSRRDVNLQARQRYPFEKYCSKVCHVASKQELYVLTIKSIRGQTDQLVDSTCRGMLARKNAGQLPKGLNDWEDILQYNGPGPANRITNVVCKDFCSEANTAMGKNSYQCDEYPPAAFNQATNVQTRLCIEQYQNSGTQAPILSALVRECKLKPGDKVLYRVEGGCPGNIVKRDETQEAPPADLTDTAAVAARALLPRAGTAIQLSGNNATLRDPRGDGSLTYVAIDLGTLQDGHYDLKVNLNGAVSNITVLDSDGETYANVDSPPSGTVNLSFDVAVGNLYVPFAVIAYTEKAINVSFTGTGTLNSSSNPSSSGAGTAKQWPSLVGAFSVMGIVAAFL